MTEIVPFDLTNDSEPAAFTNTAPAMEPAQKDTGAMIRRDLSTDATGLWTFPEVARAAAVDILQHPTAGPFMSLLGGPSVRMRNAVMHLQQA